LSLDTEHLDFIINNISGLSVSFWKLCFSGTSYF